MLSLKEWSVYNLFYKIPMAFHLDGIYEFIKNTGECKIKRLTSISIVVGFQKRESGIVRAISSLLKKSIFMIILSIKLFHPSILFAKNIVVFAATSDIGEAIVKNLIKKGHHVFATGRNHHKMKKIATLGPNVRTFFLDYTDVQTCKVLSSKINGINIDGVVLIPPRLTTLPDPKHVPTQREWQSIFDMLFINPVTCIKMLEKSISKDASIVFISGVSSIHFMPGYSNINVARAAMVIEARNIASQWKEKNVRVNVISPGAMFTSFHRKSIAKDGLERAKIELPSPEYLSYLVTFLISDESMYINGQNIVYDNGEHFLGSCK